MDRLHKKDSSQKLENITEVASDRAVYPVETPPKPRTLVDIVLDTVAQYPDAIALEDEHERVPYGEL
ncbi:MAG: hypothetical protein L0G85_08590, partial [Kocuria sp.]|nr:hypothetical protein [Kocuria sp.]